MKKDECRVGAVVPDRSTEVFLPRSPNALGSVEVNFQYNPPRYGSPRHCTTVLSYLNAEYNELLYMIYVNFFARTFPPI